MSASPKKLYYKIGEACRVLDIQPYVLRYWETEFPFLSPDKSKSGQRVYSAEELDVIRRIKELLYDEGYTIAGAKKKLEGELAAGAPGAGRSATGQEPEPPPAEQRAQVRQRPPKPRERTGGRSGDGASASPQSGDGKPPSGPLPGAAPTLEANAEASAEQRLSELRSGLEGLLREARELLDRLPPE